MNGTYIQEDANYNIADLVSDPSITGPGTWFSIHTAAKTLDFDCFLDFIYELADNFFCTECQKHFKAYLVANPPEALRQVNYNINNQSLSIGAFAWTWQFHNAVNQRLNKPIMTWESACALYNINK